MKRKNLPILQKFEVTNVPYATSSLSVLHPPPSRVSFVQILKEKSEENFSQEISFSKTAVNN